jgi:endonuclease/exonuclease/phosphatase family metal-dependent hydrolase
MFRSVALVLAVLVGDSFGPVRNSNALSNASLPNPLTLLIWNIDRGTQLHDIEQGIRKHHPDVCLLQEVDLNAKRSEGVDEASSLARDLKMNFAYGTAWQELKQGSDKSPAWQGQANLSRIPFKDSRVLRFEHQTDFWEPHWYLPAWAPQRRHGGRIALVSEIGTGPNALVFYNVHLESRSLPNRFGQLQEVLDDVDRWYPHGPVIIGGDLNTMTSIDEFVDTLEKHNFHSCFGPRHERTHRVVGDLDWIFVRAPVFCEAAAVDRDSPGSDHYLVTANITVQTARK